MKRALLIGINYKGTPYELYGCVNDINLISQALIQKYRYNPFNIMMLSDNGRKPTRANIEQGIRWLLQGTKAGDSLFFYYSGHGAYMRDASKDESDGRDELIIPLDVEKAGVITDDWLFTNMVEKVPRGASLWAFGDCCHSGTLCDLRYNMTCIPTPVTNKDQYSGYLSSEWKDTFTMSYEKSKDIRGSVCFFSGALDSQQAMDSFFGTSAQGAFTVALLIALQNGVSKKVKDLLKEVNCWLKLMGYGSQNCQLSAGSLVDLEKSITI